MKRITVLALLLVLSLALAQKVGAQKAGAQKVTVFAASSLTEAFEDVAAAFEAGHEGARVVLNFAGSSALSTQIVQGAPADVFASADAAQMQVVAAEGLLLEAHIFAGNKLVVVTPRASGLASLADLATPGVKVVLAAPEVPVGVYAREALEKLRAVYGADFKKRVEANLVSEEPNVRQAAAKVDLGEADAAVVYATDASVLKNVSVIEIPEAYNVAATYPIAVLRSASYPELAQAFVRFVLSDEGQVVLAEHGFSQVP